MQVSRSLLKGPLSGKQLGMLVALASFGMLFGSLFLGYFLVRARVSQWPPIGVDPVSPLLPFLSTVVLLISSASAHKSLLVSENAKSFRNWWRLTSFLGFVFLLLQIAVWAQMWLSGLRPDTNLFGSVYWSMIGVHALHVLGGIVALEWVRRKKVFEFESAQMAAWYWHFDDVIWVLMFVFLYLF
jgi:cytochrome c oxidase subunit III